jgi:glycerol uptake facilitator-like aquaporin
MKPSSQLPRVGLSISAHHQLRMYELFTAFMLVFGFLITADPLFAASKERVLHSFSGRDGAFPNTALILDASGNLYGTTSGGGVSKSGCNNANDLGCGITFRLTRGAKETWTETVLHRFTGSPDGSQPWASLIFDAYGTYTAQR